MSNDIKYLIALLDDEDERNASLAMAALLDGDKKNLDHYLRSLQECENPRLRRRVHQLETAFFTRQKRRMLGRCLKRSALPLFDGCIQLHLLWFDNDLAEYVLEQWNELKQKFLTDFYRYGGSVKDFLLAENFELSYNEELAAECYSIGAVLDDHFGSDVMLAVIAGELMRCAGMPCRIVRQTGGQGIFGLQLRNGEVIFFADREMEQEPAFTVMTDDQVLRYVAAMLLTCAVASDNYRYVYTIGHILKGVSPLNPPYPYGI